LLSEKGYYLIQGAYYVTNITLKKLIDTEKRYGSEVAILEVRISWDIGAVWDNGWRGKIL